MGEVTISMPSPTVSPLALTVPASTHSSTHLMLLTNKLVFLLVTKPVFSRRELRFSNLASNNQPSQSSKLSPSPPPLPQGTSSPPVSSSLTGLSPDSILTSPPNKQKILVFVKSLTDLAVKMEP